MSVYDIIGEWGIESYRTIDSPALKEITLGSSILATGGGGDPEIGLLWALNVVDQNREILMIRPDDIPDKELVAMTACLGAALVLTEKPPNGKEPMRLFDTLSKYLGKPIKAVVPPEAGGVNTPLPMAVAGEAGVPVVDADGMGRAFPELQMTSWYIRGISPAPVAATNEKGDVAIADTGDGLAAEHIIRNAAMEFGGISYIAGYTMTGRELKSSSVLNSVSMAWEIGKRVLNARREHRDPVAEILHVTKGYRAFTGKVVDIDRDFGAERTKGFSMGKVLMEGIEKDKGKSAEIVFQNEWLSLAVDGQIRCMPPDLILILDPVTAEPIRTDIVKYGYRGTILLCPAHERMRSKAGIHIVGPKAFGYDFDYVPVEQLAAPDKTDDEV